MRPEYEFDYPKAVRGKYHRRLLKEGANVVVLDPDVAPLSVRVRRTDVRLPSRNEKRRMRP
jgi:hypothetical protein